MFGRTGIIDKHGIMSDKQLLLLNREQERATDAVIDYWETNTVIPPLVVKPTGFGKSRIIRSVLKRAHLDKSFMIVGTKGVLVDQNAEAIGEYITEVFGGDSPYSLMPDISGDVVLSTWQSCLPIQSKWRLA